MNIEDADLGDVVKDARGIVWHVVGLDAAGLPRKKGPLVVLSRPGQWDHRHVDQKEFAEFTRVDA